MSLDGRTTPLLPVSDDDDSDCSENLPSGATVAELRAAVELAEFLKSQPDRELPGKKLNLFYEWAGGHKETVQKAKVEGRESGVRSLCAMFPDKLAVRRVVHDNGKGFDVVLMRAEDAKTHASLTVRLATAVAGSYDKNDSGQAALQVVDDMLRELKLELGSMAKLKKDVKERGICLRNGTEYGDKLRDKLRSSGRGEKELMVSKELAKKFEYAKKCLVVL